MSYLDTALSIAGGLGRAYGGYQRAGQQRPMTPGFGAPYGAQMPRQPMPPQMQQQQGPPHQSMLGMGLNYLRNRRATPGSGEAGREGTAMPGGENGDTGGETSNPVPMNPYPGTPPVMDQQPYAQGGIVDKPTTAIIGEDGPEMVVPLSGRADAKVSPRNVPQMSYGRR